MKESSLNYSDTLSYHQLLEISSREREPDLLRLIHELEVYQAEIGMQNNELRLAEAKARASREKFAALYDLAPMGYFTLERTGLLHELNLSGSAMLGHERGQLRGTRFHDYVTPQTLPLLEEFLQNIFQKGSRQACEVMIRAHHQGPVSLYLEGVPFEGPSQCLVTATDITQRKMTEQALLESEARLRELNATKDKFFSIISHDLKSPFTSIIGLSSLLKHKIQENSHEEAEKYAGYIQESAYRAMDLLDNLLKWSSTQTGRIHYRPQETDLNALVHDTIGLLRDAALQKNISICRQMPRQVPAWADVTMVSTILRNLLSNAIKFTHPGGKITVSARQLSGELLVAVSDTGIGIGRESLEKLFHTQAGHTTRGTLNESGTGLGLLLAREFILMHGGNIWVESEPAKGSTFFFTLPEN